MNPILEPILLHLQQGHVQAALVDLRAEIDQTPNDAPDYTAMVSAAVAIEAGRYLDARIVLHKSINGL